MVTYSIADKDGNEIGRVTDHGLGTKGMPPLQNCDRVLMRPLRRAAVSLVGRPTRHADESAVDAICDGIRAELVGKRMRKPRKAAVA